MQSVAKVAIKIRTFALYEEQTIYIYRTLMKKIILMCAAIFLAISSTMAGNALSLKDITSGKFSPKGIGSITALDDGETYAQVSKDGKKILKYSFRTGLQSDVLFDTDKTVGEKIDEFEDYILSPDGKRMLIQTKSERIYRRSFTAIYYIYTISNRKLEKLSDYGPQQAPIWSPDSKQIAFVRENDIYLVKLLYGNAESRITKDGKKNETINGIPDWVNEEEFGFSRALTFNADGTMLCWIKYNEKDVEQYSLQMFKGSNPTKTEYSEYPGLYSYKYPKAGHKNSNVEVFSYDIQSHQTRKLQVPLDTDGYIPRIHTTNDKDKIIVFTMNRHQDRLCIYTVNPRTTVSQLLVKEESNKYVQEGAMGDIKITDNHILLPSDRDGYMQLYLYTLNGTLERKVTSGNRDVTKVYGYDETTGNTYYQAAGKSPLNREIYVTQKNGKTLCLTPREGWNSANFSKSYKYFVNVWSDSKTPFEYSTYNAQGKKLAVVNDNKELKESLASYNLPQKEFFTFTTSEGVKLNGIMVKPNNFSETKKYPVIMWQYSGPGSQQVVNSWSVGSMGNGCLYDGYLAQKGFIIVCVDGRGTGGRGADFEKCTYLKLGELESKDQVETAQYLATLPYVDKDNIGIWGWSYGGFNTLMSMSEGRTVFKAGVAVAPPTDWRFYDTVYTERYMRTPDENPSGYDTNPIKRAGQLHGSLLLCHGLADDNVHPQNTFEYTEALVQADKDFRMNIYTNRNHSIYGGNTRNHLLRQIADFFVEKLK